MIFLPFPPSIQLIIAGINTRVGVENMSDKAQGLLVRVRFNALIVFSLNLGWPNSAVGIPKNAHWLLCSYD